MVLECWLHTMMFVSLLLGTMLSLSHKVDGLKTQVLYTSYPTGLVPWWCTGYSMHWSCSVSAKIYRKWTFTSTPLYTLWCCTMTDTFKMQSIRSYAIGTDVYLDDFQNISIFSWVTHNLDTGKSFFEQNGTRPHTAFLKEMFGMTGPLNSLFDVISRFCLATPVTWIKHMYFM